MKTKNKISIIGSIITIIILIALILLTNIKNNKFYIFENGLSKIFIPVQNGLILLKNKIEKKNNFFIELNELENENKKLIQENELLKQKSNEIDVLKAENNNYKNYLKLSEQYNNYEIIPTYIINQDIFNYSFNIIINAGKKDGIEENMAVVNETGVVGYIVSVTDKTAKVKTLIDTSSYISASVNDINNSIVCNGILNERKKIKGNFIESDQKIIIGDKVVTNGMGGIYPKGLNIGIVEEVIETKNITDRYVYIKTNVDFENLNYLAVLKNK